MRTLIEHSEHTPTVAENAGHLAVKHERRMKKNPWGMNSVLSCLLFVVALWGLALHPAQAGSGLYLSSELGANFAPNLDTLGTSNDRASACDEFINPMFATVTQTPGYENYNCTGPNRGATGDWENTLDGAEGILAGVAVGYGLRETYPDHFLGRFRFEVEYFYRDTEYDQTADIPSAAGESGDKLAQEILTATDRIGSVTSHNLFGNLYVDFPNSSRFTPYVGVGVGVGFTDMDYGSLWARNPDPNAITGRRIAQRGRHPPESCRDDQQRANQAFRHAVRLPGPVRRGLCAHRSAHAGGQGPLGQLRDLQRWRHRLGSAAQPSTPSAQRLE